jgi:hypothetical protein
VSELGIGLTAPQRERLVQERGGLTGLILGGGVAGLPDEVLESRCIGRAGRQSEDVAGRAREQVAADQLAQAEHERVERVGRLGRRVVAPQDVGDAVDRHHGVRVNEQQREEASESGRADRQRVAGCVRRLERPENAKSHGRRSR